MILSSFFPSVFLPFFPFCLVLFVLFCFRVYFIRLFANRLRFGRSQTVNENLLISRLMSISLTHVCVCHARSTLLAKSSIYL